MQKLRRDMQFEKDLQNIESKYPRLNPEAPDYDKEYDDALADLYQK